MSRGSVAEARRTFTLRSLTQDANWLALLGPALIFAAHALYGAKLPTASFALAAAAAVVVGACLANSRLRDELARARGLALPAALFGAVIFVALWSLTPFTPGGPHPVWAYVGISPGAATIDKSLTVMEIVKLLALACIFAIGVMTGGSDGRARLAMNAILALGAAVGLWSVLAAVAAPGSTNSRLGGPFLSANTAATLFGMLLVICLGPAVSRFRGGPQAHRRVDLAPYGGAALIFVVCLLMTASRGGFLATAAGLAAFALLQIFIGRLRPSRAAVLAIAGLGLAGALLIVVGDLLLARLFEQGWDLASRRELFALHWGAFRDAPWMGYGLGTFDTVNRMLLDAGNMRQVWTARAAHNVYLSWLEQGGLLAALPMFACVGAVLAATLRNTARRTRMTATLCALLAASVVVLAHGVTDFALETYSMAAFFSYLLGLQLRLSQGSRR